MGNCVSSKEENHEYKRERSKNTPQEIRRSNRPQPASTSLLAPPAEIGPSSRRNLFKTFSDWSDENPATEIEKLEAREARKRKGSENLCQIQLRSGQKSTSLSDESK